MLTMWRLYFMKVGWNSVQGEAVAFENEINGENKIHGENGTTICWSSCLWNEI